jgi:MFS family permease
MMWIAAYTIATDLAASHARGQAVGQVDEAAAQGQLLGGIAGFVLFASLPRGVGWQVVFAGYALLAALGAWIGWKNVPETALQTTAPAADAPAAGERTLSAQLLRLMARLMAIVFITAASMSMLSPLFLIFLQDRFTTDIATLVMATIPAGIVASTLPSRLGTLSDRFGRTRLMAIGLLGSAAVSFLLPVVPGIVWLAVIWTLESIGWAIAGPAQEAMVADLTGHQVRGKGYGLYTFAGGLGAAIGPLVGGWLYDAAGQCVPFYLNGAVLLAGAVLVVVLLNVKRVT